MVATTDRDKVPLENTTGMVATADRWVTSGLWSQQVPSGLRVRHGRDAQIDGQRGFGGRDT